MVILTSSYSFSQSIDMKDRYKIDEIIQIKKTIPDGVKELGCGVFDSNGNKISISTINCNGDTLKLFSYDKEGKVWIVLIYFKDKPETITKQISIGGDVPPEPDPPPTPKEFKERIKKDIPKAQTAEERFNKTGIQLSFTQGLTKYDSWNDKIEEQIRLTLNVINTFPQSMQAAWSTWIALWANESRKEPLSKNLWEETLEVLSN